MARGTLTSELRSVADDPDTVRLLAATCASPTVNGSAPVPAFCAMLWSAICDNVGGVLPAVTVSRNVLLVVEVPSLTE